MAESRTQAAEHVRRQPIAVAVVVVLTAAIGAAALLLVSIGGGGGGRTSAPPWSAPTDVEQRAEDAGLTMLTKEGVVMHLHEHLSITVDGKAVTVPAHIGIDTVADRYSPIHTHDTTGVVHVESPVRRTFRLGQVFTEWDVALGPGGVGGYHDGRDGVRVATFVDRRAVTGDPRDIALGERQDIDLVVTTDGSAPVAPTKAYAFPANY
jgi:hypothetical protein